VKRGHWIGGGSRRSPRHCHLNGSQSGLESCLQSCPQCCLQCCPQSCLQRGNCPRICGLQGCCPPLYDEVEGSSVDCLVWTTEEREQGPLSVIPAVVPAVVPLAVAPLAVAPLAPLLAAAPLVRPPLAAALLAAPVPVAALAAPLEFAQPLAWQTLPVPGFPAGPARPQAGAGPHLDTAATGDHTLA